MLKAILIIIGFGLMSCTGQMEKPNTEANDCLQTVDLETFAAGLTESVQIVDVRTPKEMANGYIPGSVNIDFKDDNFDQQILKLSKEKPVYVYCAAGSRSRKAGEFLKKNGYCDIYELKGGMTAWQSSGKDVAK